LRNKKLNTQEIKNIMNTIKDQVTQAKQQLNDAKENKKLDDKVRVVESNLQVNKDSLTSEDVNKAVSAGFIFYNPINKQPIPKYAGRIKLGGRINLSGRINLAGQLNPKVWNLLKKPRGPKGSKIMPSQRPGFQKNLRIHNVPSQVHNQIMSQVPESKEIKTGEQIMNGGCKKQSSGCQSKTKKITSLDELRMKYSN